MRLAHPHLRFCVLAALALAACDQPSGDNAARRLQAQPEAVSARAAPELSAAPAPFVPRDLARWHGPASAPLGSWPPAPSDDPAPPAPTAPQCSGALPWLDAPPTVSDLTPTDLAPFDHLAMRVALSGPWLVAGADGNDEASSDAGAVRLWRRTGAGWTPAGRLASSRAAASEHFGWDVDIERDTLAVAAPGAASAGLPDAGAVDLFSYDPAAGWLHAGRLDTQPPVAGARFGEAVRLDAARIAVGAPGELGHRGAVYVFAATDAGWQLEARLVSPTAALGDEFGAAIALAGDLLVVGAPEAADGDGAAWVFRRGALGWGAAEPIASDLVASGARFGGAVAAARGIVLVGADEDSPGGLVEAGSVLALTRVDGVWQGRTRLLDRVPAPGGHFGAALRFDGAIAAISTWAVNEGPEASDGVMLFAPAKGGWARLTRLTDAAGAADDRLGTGIALGDGVVAVGAWGADGIAPDGGRLLVFGYGACDPTEPQSAR